MSAPQKERLRLLLARMPLERGHRENLLRDLETMDEEKAARLADELEGLVAVIDSKAGRAKPESKS